MGSAGALVLRALILGPPGSGKGTLSSRIAHHFALHHLSSGDLLRENMNRRTGCVVLLCLPFAIDSLLDFLCKARATVLLWPVLQPSPYSLENGNSSSLISLHDKKMGLDDDTGEPLIQRDDDKPETVMKRLKSYEAETRPVLEYYRQKGVLKTFAGTETNKIWPHVHSFLRTKLPDIG
ncbi:hypothetical protein JD844_009260 [Phrynosoma platyrhinos]|uniref:Nucleoside-diphosphate kinase n=1 Tax=Phrynosoma platyrhinos TaxID=52577 RepID=A0ABQ7TF95_PHRPL|nr:hypothetical protein JD844_009260 [Phrynosoma platyrhinos]